MVKYIKAYYDNNIIQYKYEFFKRKYKMFQKKRELYRGKEAIVVSGLSDMSLSDTFLCGQAFRFEETVREGSYVEYMTVVGGTLVFVGQRTPGELIFYGADDIEFEEVISPYFDLDTDYGAILEDILSRTDSRWLRSAAKAGSGIRILKQEPWETLFSFIISQNNNIPRIRKIIRSISLEYGENLALKKGLSVCPLSKDGKAPSEKLCGSCGACYTFPTAKAVTKEPQKLLPSHPGFRYKYLVDAANRVDSGETDLSLIYEKKSYEYTLTELKKILGVGDKVASCAALFGFGNLEAFPIDVWMKRAIDEYFDGHLDYEALGEYRGVAQQYIFHYIRNLENKS